MDIMITEQAQIKITLPLLLKDFLESKAQRLGLPIASYVRHLIVSDIEDMDYPVFEASDSTIKAYKKAIKDKDKAITITSKEELDNFFKNL